MWTWRIDPRHALYDGRDASPMALEHSTMHSQQPTKLTADVIVELQQWNESRLPNEQSCKILKMNQPATQHYSLAYNITNQPLQAMVSGTHHPPNNEHWVEAVMKITNTIGPDHSNRQPLHRLKQMSTDSAKFLLITKWTQQLCLCFRTKWTWQYGMHAQCTSFPHCLW